MKLKDTTTYRTYDIVWRRLEKDFGKLDVSKFTEEQARTFCSESMSKARQTYIERASKRAEKGFQTREEYGHCSYNLALDVLGKIMTYAIKEGAIAKSPLDEIKRKPMGESERHGLAPAEIEEILQVAKSGGNDPELDFLMLWMIVETACRSAGVRNLRLGDVDVKNQTLRLVEKRGKVRNQPITKELAQRLINLANERGSTKDSDSVFRYHPEGNGKGRPVTSRRFERLWERIGLELSWVAEKQISNHWLRHTTLTWVDRVSASGAITSKYAGHGGLNVTDNYSKGRLGEIREVHKLLFEK